MTDEIPRLPDCLIISFLLFDFPCDCIQDLACFNSNIFHVVVTAKSVMP